LDRNVDTLLLREMIKKMSDFFGVPENRVYIISGQTSRKKIIEIQNISKQYRFYKMEHAVGK